VQYQLVDDIDVGVIIFIVFFTCKDNQSCLFFLWIGFEWDC